MTQSVDVCVFGVGPAGSAVASRLADSAVDVLILDRPAKAKPWGGESFTGAIQKPLSQLGLWQRFLDDNHVAGYEQRISWGGEPWTKSSILNRDGNIWHVDREKFDTSLRQAVLDRGVPILPYLQLNRLQKTRDAWHIQVDGVTEVRAKYLVDATGRSRAVARRLGLPAKNLDRLVGLAKQLSRNAQFPNTMLIESTPLGWWYTAPVPQGHVLVFFTDADLAPKEFTRSMRLVAANSSFAQPALEQGWITVGDACAAHDPLCGWGVHRALSNGLIAADAIAQHLRKADPTPLQHYRQHCNNQFASYLTGLTRHYSDEQRWNNAPFWQRRVC